MALLPQNPRSQKLLVVGLMAVGIAVAYHQLVWTPKNTELGLIAVRLDSLDALNKMAKFEVAKGSASKMKQEADMYGRELAVLRHLVPLENEVPALLESVSTAARRANLELSDVQPDGVVNGDVFNTYRYSAIGGAPHDRPRPHLRPRLRRDECGSHQTSVSAPEALMRTAAVLTASPSAAPRQQDEPPPPGKGDGGSQLTDRSMA